jgi:ADP-ribose pyrophosphatase YjhB (NUDIX family)
MLFKKVSGKGTKSSTLTTIASGPVLIKDNKVLLSKDIKDPFWKFPGGTVLDTESFRETALRELMEETNLSAELEEIPILFTFHNEDNNVVMYYVLIHYLANNPKGEIKINDPDVEEVNYFDLDKLPENLAPNILPVLTQLNLV